MGHKSYNLSLLKYVKGKSQIQGHPSNGYDFDLIDTPHGQAVIFVMNKGKSGRDPRQIVEGGEWIRSFMTYKVSLNHTKGQYRSCYRNLNLVVTGSKS